MSTAAKAPAKSRGKARAAVAETDAVSLEPILAAVRKRVPKARHAEAEAFVNAFYRRMSADELPQHDADGWAALAVDFLDFARTRKPGTALVRLFNPTCKEHGWESPHTALQIANDDMPFLVDSVTMALAERGIGVHVLGHPVVKLVREKAGKVTAVGEGVAESLMCLEIDRQAPESMAAIKSVVEDVLDDVRAIVNDWSQMRDRMTDVANDLVNRTMPVDEAGRVEAQEFLRWASDNHFTFLGYREYEVGKEGGKEVLRAVKGSGLGLLRGKEVGKPRLLTSLAAHYMPQSGSVDALILTKTNARSTVHRPGYMDYIGVLTFDKDGKPVREERFLGLYTSSAYTRRPWDIPLVRQRHEYVMAQSGLAPDSHSGKALRHILETLPRDEMFQANEHELLSTASGILGLQERVRSKLFLRRDRYGRFFSGLVYIPRDRFNTDVRLRIEAMLKRVLEGEHIDSSVVMGESPLAQLHLIVRPKSGEAVEVDNAAIEAELAAIVRNWHDDLREALVKRHGEEKGLKLANTLGRALPQGYIEGASVAVAADDVEHLAALKDDNDLRLSLYRAHGIGDLRLKFYRLGADLQLSDALPLMENMGLRVLTEHPYRVVTGDTVAYIQDFDVSIVGKNLDVDANRAQFEDAFVRAWRGEVENDGFNRLVLGAGLSWRQVAMLRAYCKYLLQVGVPFSQHYVEETFNRYPLLARMLVELFEARFDPATGKESKAEIKAGMEHFTRQVEALAGGDEGVMAVVKPVIDARAGKREVQTEAARAALLGLLDRVSSLDEDRILRSFIGVIEATLRTSYYMDRKDGVRADGGPADYVSFKFDAAKVPDAPKPRPYREIFVYGPRVEGVHLRFGPDNIVDGKIVPPLNVVRHDNDDPYLVVAADKGTATFSDTANAIARAHGFWLDDAFASGGSVGYDHKGMGITARGAWESVKRHFRALGRDSQKQDFTAAGVGDMSGDVFGNGMLLSKHIRLLAAFDHRHIFLDPNPDAAVTFKERQRMFKLPRSSWDDYDRSKISQGGGVFARSLKSIPLSPEVRAMLDLKAEAVSPAELMTAILKARAELLYLGGIGTYVKAASETHADVGDRANNALRVNGRDLRCKARTMR